MILPDKFQKSVYDQFSISFYPVLEYLKMTHKSFSLCMYHLCRWCRIQIYFFGSWIICKWKYHNRWRWRDKGCDWWCAWSQSRRCSWRCYAYNTFAVCSDFTLYTVFLCYWFDKLCDLIIKCISTIFLINPPSAMLILPVPMILCCCRHAI